MSVAPVPVMKPRSISRATIIEDVIKKVTPPDLFYQVKFDISLESRSAGNLFELMDQNIIVIDPDMQRKYVWDGITASRFIESVVYRLPIPPVILEERGDKYFVVDGVQRLTTIYLFKTDRLRLRGVLSDRLRGKTYSRLEKVYRDRFDHLSAIPIMRIKIASPDQRYRAYATLEIFRRINLGSVKLTLRQVLYCTVTAPVIRYAKRLANSEEFKPFINERDMRNFFHCDFAVAIMETLHDGRIDYVSYREDDRIIRFMVETDEETARKLYDKAVKIVQVWKSLGLKREDLCPVTYGLSQSKAPNRVLIQLLTYATAPLLDAGRNVKVDIKRILREKLAGSRMIHDKPLRELYLIRKSSRELFLKVMRDIAEEIRGEIERAR